MIKNKWIGYILFMAFSIAFIFLIDYILTNETPKQIDDTEHLWNGDNGIQFYE